jgi:hypothetical protein
MSELPVTPTETPTPEPTPEPAAPPTSVLDAPAAPAPFDPVALALPEGFDREAPAFAEFTELARDSGFTGEQAQKLVDFHLKHTQAATEAQLAQWQTTQDGWIAEVKVDKEIGNIDALRQTIAKVADNANLTDPGFKEALALTGAGNHPAVLRTLFRWAKALGEGGPVSGEAPARQPNGALATSGPVSLAEAIYGPQGPHSGGPKI